MKSLKKLYLSFVLSLIAVLLLCLPKTNAKFLYENYGIAWDNHFTSFSQLKEVFYIEKSEGQNVNELWGAINSTVHIPEGEINGDSDLTGDKVVDDFYSFGPFNSKTEITIDEIKTTYSNYLIEKLKNIEINIVNQTKERMVVCFKIYYYAPKIERAVASFGEIFANDGNRTGSDDASVHLTFGVYNTILHNQATGNSLIGEIIANTGGRNFSDGEYSGVIEIPSERTSGNAGSEFVIADGTYYYPHRIEINPYQILYDSGKYTIQTEKFHTNRKDENGTAVCFKYPAQDYQTSGTTNKYAHQILSSVDLEDFILDESESGSFNLSMYFGNYGDTSTQSNSASFVTCLALVAIPESEIIEDIEANGGTAPATA